MRQPLDVFYGKASGATDLLDVITKPFTRVTLERVWQVTVKPTALYELAERGLLRLRADMKPQETTERDLDPANPAYFLYAPTRIKCVWYEVIEEKREEAIAALQHLDAISRLGG